jgi:predicted TIM-barrel fold metal-dependent hydrolase
VRVDAHLHVYPAGYAAALPDGPMPKPALAQARETMASYRIDAAVVSTGPPGVYFGDQGQANELARLINEELAALVRAEPGQFAALAALPLPDVDGAIREAAHALDELGLDGVWLMSNVAGTYLGEEALAPLFDELERRGAYVFVHPGFPPYEPPLDWPAWLLELPFETTRALVQLLYSGTFERCPSIRFQLAHLGGTVPFLADRIASLVDREPRFRAALSERPERYLERLWYDTGLSNAQPGIAATVEAASLDRIVFGTDWPYAALPEGDDPAPALAQLGSLREQIDAANIAPLVGRFAA